MCSCDSGLTTFSSLAKMVSESELSHSSIRNSLPTALFFPARASEQSPKALDFHLRVWALRMAGVNVRVFRMGAMQSHDWNPMAQAE